MRSLTLRAPQPRRARRRRLPRAWRRAAWWIGLPLLLAVLGLMSAAADPSLLRDASLPHAEDDLIAASAALGLVVTDIEVEGRTTTSRQTILAALGAERGTPILGVSPERAKRRLERLPWVRSAVIERRLPGTLYVRLVERVPLALWQHDDRLQLIDRDGAVIAVTDLAPFAKLPMVVGDDAPTHAAALIDMLASVPALAARVTAAIRIGGRRWNLRIDNAIDVLLPERNAAEAWTRLAELERTQKLLQRDVQSVDMRLPDRLVVRVNGSPTEAAAPAKKGHPAASTL